MTDRRAEALVSTAWLAEHLDDPNVRIADATFHLADLGRDAQAEFEAQHIPGAVFFDIDDIADPDHELTHMLPDAKLFAEKVGALGLGDGKKIVVYDSLGLYSAARVWWMFKLFGHDDVAVLDGGLPKWLAEGRPIEIGAQNPSPAAFTPNEHPEMVQRWQDVLAALDKPDLQLVDARTPGRWSGAEQDRYPGVRRGHMPGSVNLYWAELLNPDKTVRTTDELRQLFDARGVDLNREVITTCGSGVTACMLGLALHMVGNDRWTVYDGSWDEWGRREDLPAVSEA
ncbi:MAG: 3-mercaptopyruvate sulfurtransferase [Rhodospirillaceae bacterium]|nr:3-mercaptopyruvate sulfurtransferase [Rhodospirillaceae bacterium]